MAALAGQALFAHGVGDPDDFDDDDFADPKGDFSDDDGGGEAKLGAGAPDGSRRSRPSRASRGSNLRELEELAGSVGGRGGAAPVGPVGGSERFAALEKELEALASRAGVGAGSPLSALADSDSSDEEETRATK